MANEITFDKLPQAVGYLTEYESEASKLWRYYSCRLLSTSIVFNLYLCERFGYRNACSVMWNENGICISIYRESLDIYLRFWECRKGVGNYPDWNIIIARCEFRDELREDRFELFKDLVRFFKEYMPATGINTSPPRMTTTIITKRSTSTASNAALWDAIATMEHH